MAVLPGQTGEVLLPTFHKKKEYFFRKTYLLTSLISCLPPLPTYALNIIKKCVCTHTHMHTHISTNTQTNSGKTYKNKLVYEREIVGLRCSTYNEYCLLVCTVLYKLPNVSEEPNASLFRVLNLLPHPESRTLKMAAAGS